MTLHTHLVPAGHRLASSKACALRKPRAARLSPSLNLLARAAMPAVGGRAMARRSGALDHARSQVDHLDHPVPGTRFDDIPGSPGEADALLVATAGERSFHVGARRRV